MSERNLWAPWRIQYIQSMKDELSGKGGCIFCDKQKSDDRESLIICRGKFSFVMLNIYPYNNGHLLFAPYEHLADTDLLADGHILEIFSFINAYKKLLKEKLHCDGFNMGVNFGRAAGAGIEDHIHFHLVPRWNGDTNFMPVLGDTKVISQSLEEVWKLLTKRENESLK